MNARNRKGRKGFTLIELLIVVVIIGILAAIAIPKFGSTRRKAFRSAMLSDLKNMASVQEMYHTNNFTYTTDLALLGAIESEGITLTVNEASNVGWSASAVHEGIPGESCAIFQGQAAPVAPATIEGLSACTF